jgi:hypothetical protein
MSTNYEVICGNIGYVYQGTDREQAESDFAEYVDQSNRRVGSRAYGEDVTLSADGAIVREHIGQPAPTAVEDYQENANYGHIRNAVQDHAIGSHLYYDAAESDPSERYLIMHNDEVIGAGRNRCAAWYDAYRELGL